MSEQEFDNEIISDTSEEMMQELVDEAAAGDVEVSEIQEKEDRLGKLFTLVYRIPFEDYLEFHKVMSADMVKAGKKKTVLLGWVELIFGVAFLISLATSQTKGSAFYYFIIATLIGMGLYGICYYRFLYERTLRKNLQKQHSRTPYLQSEIQVDFYPNKFVEHVGDSEAETFWHSILSVKENERLYMILLEAKRCLLIPKREVKAQLDALDALLDEVCKNFEKPHYSI